MAIEAPSSSSSSLFSPWPDRLRHSAIVLLVAGLALSLLVLFDEFSPLPARASPPRARRGAPAACGGRRGGPCPGGVSPPPPPAGSSTSIPLRPSLRPP